MLRWDELPQEMQLSEVNFQALSRFVSSLSLVNLDFTRVFGSKHLDQAR